MLEETLEQLSSVYKKLCDIREITEAEMEWLEQLVTSTDIKISSQGVMEVLNEEIDKHKVCHKVFIISSNLMYCYYIHVHVG